MMQSPRKLYLKLILSVTSEFFLFLSNKDERTHSSRHQSQAKY